ncbi:MAG: TolC family protein [Microbacter sp.]
MKRIRRIVNLKRAIKSAYALENDDLTSSILSVKNKNRRMNQIIKHRAVFFALLTTILLSPFGASRVVAQSSSTPINDSLSLSTALKQVMATYPTIQEARQAIIAANAQIGLSKSRYLPNISFSSSYAHLNPTTTITFPGLGTFQMNPSNNYNATINLDQNIYDFGKTKAGVDYAKQNSELAKLNESQLKQQLSLIVINGFYSIDYLQQAIKIKDDELKNLYDHLHFIQKKAATGSATEYEILTTQVRISAIENQRTDLETSLKIAQSQLNALLGKPQTNPLTVKNDLTAPMTIIQNDSLIAQALRQREEMKIATQKMLLAQLQLKQVNVANNPSFNFMANGGYKNGYIPDLNAMKANYLVGVSLNIPIFDASRTKYNRMAAKAQIESALQDQDLTKRNVESNVIQSYENTRSAQQKVTEATMQVRQAKKAYHLAQVSYESGSITNLDLLDSAVNLAESELSLLKTQIDYTVSLYQLKIALGETVY